MELFGDWGVRHQGLFTFSHSPKHVALYQSYGFLPRFLTLVMAKAVTPTHADTPTTLSASGDPEAAIAACAAVTNAIYGGFEVEREIRAAERQKLGDTVLIPEGSELGAFAVCHLGAGTEAGSNACFIKFGAARPGADAPTRFSRLLDACEAFAAGNGAAVLIAGVSTARRGAYQELIDRGFRAELIGVTMHRPDEDGYHHPGAWVIDDWR
jgi:hypothetical protein